MWTGWSVNGHNSKSSIISLNQLICLWLYFFSFLSHLVNLASSLLRHISTTNNNFNATGTISLHFLKIIESYPSHNSPLHLMVFLSPSPPILTPRIYAQVSLSHSPNAAYTVSQHIAQTIFGFPFLLCRLTSKIPYMLELTKWEKLNRQIHILFHLGTHSGEKTRILTCW